MESQKAGDKWYSPLGWLGLSSQCSLSFQAGAQRAVRRNQIGLSLATERQTNFGCHCGKIFLNSPEEIMAVTFYLKILTSVNVVFNL